jgi:hypothetical protein
LSPITAAREINNIPSALQPFDESTRSVGWDDAGGASRFTRGGVTAVLPAWASGADGKTTSTMQTLALYFAEQGKRRRATLFGGSPCRSLNPQTS